MMNFLSQNELILMVALGVLICLIVLLLLRRLRNARKTRKNNDDQGGWDNAYYLTRNHDSDPGGDSSD